MIQYIARFFIIISYFLTIVFGNHTSAQSNDFEILKEVMINKEGKLNLHTSMDSINGVWKKIDEALENTESILDHYKLYSQAISVISCGHTQIQPNKLVLKEWLSKRNSLPFDYSLVGKRLFVNKLNPRDEEIVTKNKPKHELKTRVEENTEIIEINHQSVPQIMERISPFLSSDENGIDFKYFQASQYFEFLRQISDQEKVDSIHVRFVLGTDTTDRYFTPGTAPVHSINTRLAKLTEAYNKNIQNFGTFNIKQSKYAYFRFKSFKPCVGKKYELFLKSSFETIKKRGINQMIVDLRGNTGGVMQYSFMRYIVGEDVVLGRYVVEKPKQKTNNKHLKKFNREFFKHKRMSRIQARAIRRKKFNNGEVKTSSVKENLIFHGDIIVITDEGTFSAASILASHLKTLSNAKIIGATSGGSFYRGNAGTLQVRLPDSKMTLMVNPNTFYSQLEVPLNPQKIKIPDIILAPTPARESKTDLFYIDEAKKAFRLFFL